MSSTSSAPLLPPRLTPAPEHILNTPKTLVADSLAGLAFYNPATLLYDTTLILRKPSQRVHLLCGGLDREGAAAGRATRVQESESVGGGESR